MRQVPLSCAHFALPLIAPAFCTQRQRAGILRLDNGVATDAAVLQLLARVAAQPFASKQLLHLGAMVQLDELKARAPPELLPLIDAVVAAMLTAPQLVRRCLQALAVLPRAPGVRAPARPAPPHGEQHLRNLHTCRAAGGGHALQRATRSVDRPCLACRRPADDCAARGAHGSCLLPTLCACRPPLRRLAQHCPSA